MNNKQQLTKIWNTAVSKVGGFENNEENFVAIANEFISMSKVDFTKQEMLEYINETWKDACDFIEMA